MSRPQVSVVIASYNYAHFVCQAIESALCQTMPDVEVILVDDGSHDNTREVLARYRGHARVRIHHNPHAGHPQAKNFGVAQARGEFVAFLDADDAWLPTKLERQLELFAANPALGVVYGRCQRMDQEGRRLVTPTAKLHRGWIVESLVADNFVCFSSALVRRELLAGDATFDNQLNDPIDYDLWLRLALVAPFEYVDEPLVLYRVGHASMSRTNNRWREQVDRVMQRFRTEYGGDRAVSRSAWRAAEYARLCECGFQVREQSRWAAWECYLAAIRTAPLERSAWYGLAALWWPESGRRLMRRLMGRPSDWRQPRLAER